MRPSTTARLAAGLALIAAMVVIALVLAREDVEAPNRIDYFGATPPDVCLTVTSGIGPHLCLTDAPPTPTPDFGERRDDLTLSPALQRIVRATEAGDVDQIMAWTQKYNLCEVRLREPWPECADAAYVEAVWQIYQGMARPAPRTAATMDEWLRNLLDDNRAHLVLVGNDADATDQSPVVIILLFQLAAPASPDNSSDRRDYLALRVRDDDVPVIEEIGFSINEILQAEAVDRGIAEINGIARFRILPTYCHSSFARLCSHLPTAAP